MTEGYSNYLMSAYVPRWMHWRFLLANLDIINEWRYERACETIHNNTNFAVQANLISDIQASRLLLREQIQISTSFDQ